MNPDIPNFNKRERKEPLFGKEYFLKRFHWLKDDHSDELPDQDVRELYAHGHPKCDTFKCQGNYIAGLKHDLEGALIDKTFDNPEFEKKVKEFLTYKFNFNRFTTREEIDMINKILDEVINYLENK
ncbi:hypothetical protein KAJ89_02260 [Candidatus Parcubacteria bacterium]|nr:hypothetical protein [Candidatus Parcubacteria bacterium]